MFRIFTITFLLMLAVDAEENKTLKESSREIKALFAPLTDTMRGKQISLLADIHADENEAKKKLVPYLIFNLIKQEIDHLEQSSYDNPDLEKMRKEALEKLYDSRKKYVNYSDILSFMEEISADEK